MKTFLACLGFCVLFLFVAGTCVACDDDDEKGSWSRPASEVAAGRDHDDEESSRNRPGNDCNQSKNCSDDDKVDFRPVICLPESTCQFEPANSASAWPVSIG